MPAVLATRCAALVPRLVVINRDGYHANLKSALQGHSDGPARMARDHERPRLKRSARSRLPTLVASGSSCAGPPYQSGHAIVSSVASRSLPPSASCAAYANRAGRSLKLGVGLAPNSERR